MEARDMFRYYFKVDNKIVFTGITKDLGRREREHQQEYPNGHIVQKGNRTTEEVAQEWEKDEEVKRNDR